MSHRAVIVVRDGRHPLAVLTMLACMLSGLVGLLSTPQPTTLVVDRLLPEPWRSTYYALLLVSGLIVSVAVWLPDVRDRLMWERIGLLPFTGVLLAYPLALINAGVNGFPVGVAIGAFFGVGGLWRILQLTRALRQWRMLMRQQRGEVE